ncbi:hypothetical protein ALT761_00538 [Alteromonas sp. 76-1]|nr:hypothetical protein ALT761_00538 [Alteromonas sp. 76-1]
MWAIMRSSPRVCVPTNEVSDLIFLLCAKPQSPSEFTLGEFGLFAI